jgi:DNA-binding phage protein
MAADKKRAALRKTVKDLVTMRDRLGRAIGDNEDALIDAMRTAYEGGVTAIELAEITGIPRQNIYDWLRAGGEIQLQQPKKVKA